MGEKGETGDTLYELICPFWPKCRGLERRNRSGFSSLARRRGHPAFWRRQAPLGRDCEASCKFPRAMLRVHGSVLVAGGFYNGSYLANAELY